MGLLFRMLRDALGPSPRRPTNPIRSSCLLCQMGYGHSRDEYLWQRWRMKTRANEVLNPTGFHLGEF